MIISQELQHQKSQICVLDTEKLSQYHWQNQVGASETPPSPFFKMFMQFSGNFTKIMGFHSTFGVNDPCFGKSWIRHWVLDWF